MTEPIRRGVDYSWDRPNPAKLMVDGYSFAVRYLSYQTNGKNLTRSEAEVLCFYGIDLVLVWENKADDFLGGFDVGVRHARAARNQAAILGKPEWAPIYFAIDKDTRGDDKVAEMAVDYLNGVGVILDADHMGVYGGIDIVRTARAEDIAAYSWQTKAWSAGQWDANAELRQVEHNLTYETTSAGKAVKIDVNEAWSPDFGQWHIGQV